MAWTRLRLITAAARPDWTDWVWTMWTNAFGYFGTSGRPRDSFRLIEVKILYLMEMDKWGKSGRLFYYYKFFIFSSPLLPLALPDAQKLAMLRLPATDGPTDAVAFCDSTFDANTQNWQGTTALGRLNIGWVNLCLERAKVVCHPRNGFLLLKSIIFCLFQTLFFTF